MKKCLFFLILLHACEKGNSQICETINLIVQVNGVIPSEGTITEFFIYANSRKDTLQLIYFPGGAVLIDQINKYELLRSIDDSVIEIKFVMLEDPKIFKKKEYYFKIKATNLLQRYCIISIEDIGKRREQRRMNKKYYVDYITPIEEAKSIRLK